MALFLQRKVQAASSRATTSYFPTPSPFWLLTPPLLLQLPNSVLWDEDKSSHREVGGMFKREGTYVYLGLIHTDVWQKPTQHCKAIILQFKKENSHTHTWTKGLIP